MEPVGRGGIIERSGFNCGFSVKNGCCLGSAAEAEILAMLYGLRLAWERGCPSSKDRG